MLQPAQGEQTLTAGQQGPGRAGRYDDRNRRQDPEGLPDPDQQGQLDDRRHREDQEEPPPHGAGNIPGLLNPVDGANSPLPANRSAGL